MQTNNQCAVHAMRQYYNDDISKRSFRIVTVMRLSTD